MRHGFFIALTAFALGLALPAQAQDSNVAFAGLKTDVSQPVQIDADQLSVCFI